MKPLVDKGYLNQALAAMAGIASSEDRCVEALHQQICVQRRLAVESVDRGRQLEAIGDMSGAAAAFRSARALDLDTPYAVDGMNRATAIDARQIATALVPAIVWFLALLVGATLCSYVVPAGLDGLSNPMTLLCRILGAAVLLVVAALVAYPPLGWASSAGSAYPLVSATLLGVLLIAVGVGLRLRMRVVMTDSDGKNNENASAYIVSRMNLLGSDRPRGSWITQGTDVTALPEDALTTLPQGKVLAALVKATRTVVPSAAWQAKVAVVSGRRLSVHVTRNGKSVGAALIDVADLVPPEANPTDDKDAEEILRNAVASFLLLTLAQRHRALRTGLCGATRWEALALYVVGAGRIDENDGLALVSRAASLDPEVKPYQIAELLGRARSSPALNRIIREELRGIAHEMNEAQSESETSTSSILQPRKGEEALLLRTLYSAVSLGLNAIGPDDAAAAAPTLEELCADAAQLLRGCQQYAEGKSSPLQAFAAELKFRAAARWHAARLLAGTPVETDKFKDLDSIEEEWCDRKPRSSEERYDKACALLLETDGRESAINQLQLALSDTEMKRWAVSDPWLNGVRDDPRIAALIGSATA